MKKKPYYVEQGNTGCYACNKGITWDIIDPNGVALGQSWEIRMKLNGLQSN